MEQELQEIFGERFIREVEPRMVNYPGSVKKERQILLKCIGCKKEFTTGLFNAKRINQKYCSVSCHHRQVEEFTGGNEKHPLYSRWLSMNQRCNNPKHSNYVNYGERGIVIAEELKTFSDYVKIVTSLPNCPKDLKNTKLSLDRIDNNGMYSKENLRWTCRNTQAVNQRNRKETYSKYRGVSWSKVHNRWVVRLSYKGKRYCSSTHLTEHEALVARNAAIINNNLPHPIQEC